MQNEVKDLTTFENITVFENQVSEKIELPLRLQ